ncbi:pyridoxamine 5'-phosphate oxidase [Sorangium cellulosum]|uniref:Pyridoxamine 5'-phosphate oxidase n=1 Tax=Sorangium cellulosum TaxID=56 RepID=A0A2L0EU48_SORCE|nr:pyridoxamine 5'-phosphate oxidase family protein [Sorangium cellulosum]AUX42820.1 pyridoxamine 5'-phosphate oxidase [Sorangium cellulosum]
METGSREKLMEILKKFRNAMLVTQASHGVLRSRPMALMKVDDATGDIWFMTSIDSGKVDEIESNPEVNVTLQEEHRYLSLSGRASIVRSRAKIEELWSEEAKVFFPRGKDDPHLALIHVSPREGEYWDNHGAAGLRFLVEAVKAYVTGTTPKADSTQHGAVPLSAGQTANGLTSSR